jgi:hypothetical protein
MKACPSCQEKNHDRSTFSTKCGFQLSNQSFDDKRKKVVEGRRKSFLAPVLLTLIASSIIWILYLMLSTERKLGPKLSLEPKIRERIDHSGKTLKMTDIQVRVDQGNILIPVDVLTRNRLVRFEYEANGVKYPLLAYVTPSGRVVTAISTCEPCRSTRFHINGEKLICDACYTEWDLETLKGIQGGCLNYPPDAIPSRIDKDHIAIDEKVVVQWRPRV